MIIITEGLDSSGKTSIADYLSEKHNFQRYHEYKEIKNLIPFDKELDNWVYFEAGAVGYMLPMFKAFDNFVIDRFHISSYVYARFFNRKELIKIDQKEKLMKETKKKIKVFYCDIDYDTYVKRHEIRKENYLSVNQFFQQKELFEEGLNLTHFDVIKFDGSKSLKETKQKVSSVITELTK